jgi:hypothetical protein
MYHIFPYGKLVFMGMWLPVTDTDNNSVGFSILGVIEGTVKYNPRAYKPTELETINIIHHPYIANGVFLNNWLELK